PPRSEAEWPAAGVSGTSGPPRGAAGRFASREVNVRSRAALQLDCLLPGGLAIHPGLERITSGRKSAQLEAAILVRRYEVRRVEHENEPAHVFVDVAVERHKARYIEELRGNRALVGQVAPEIEPLGLRVGKDVVIRVVLVGELDRGARANCEQRRHESQI